MLGVFCFGWNLLVWAAELVRGHRCLVLGMMDSLTFLCSLHMRKYHLSCKLIKYKNVRYRPLSLDVNELG